MAITDQRDLIGDATVTTDWTGNSLQTTTTVAPPGVTTVLSAKISNTLGGIVYDDNATNTFADGDTIYVWWSFLFGALDTIAGGGVRMFFSGASTADFFSVIIGGSDSGKSGWQLTAVNIGEARLNPDFVGGTPPAASAIEQIGIEFNVTANVTGNNDNVAVANIYRQTDAERTYRVDAGTDGTPNTWQAIADQVLTDGTGVFTKDTAGVFTLRGSIAFGPAAGDVDMTFDDTNVVLAFEDYGFLAPGFYQLEMDLPGAYAGDARLTAGVRIGSGDSSVGVGGWTVLTGGPRYDMKFNDVDATDVQFFGCSFTGSGTWAVDQTAVEIRSCVFADCDTLTHNNGCTVVKCFFAAAPGPGPQIDLEDDPASTDFFENVFVNMSWWAIEISEAGAATYTLRGLQYAGNGANRDVLLSHTTGLLTLAVVDSPNGISGDTPGVTNGASITVTTAGASDIRMSAVGLDNVNQTTPIETSSGANTIVGVDPLTAAVTPDNADNYLAAVYGADVFGTIDWTGSSAYVEEVEEFDVLNGAVIGGASKTGVTGAQTASANHSGTVLNAALTVLNVDEEVAGPVVQVDPEWRPVAKTLASATHVFSYGVAHALTPSDDLCALVFVHTQDPTAADTNITSVSWGGTNMTEVREDFADDSGGGGEGLRTTAFRLIGADLRKGTFAVENNVTIEIFGVTEGSRVVIERSDTEVELLNALAFVADGQGFFKAGVSFNYVSDTTVRVSAAASGKVVAAIAEDQSEGGPFTDETIEANDSRVAEGMTLVPTIAAPAIGDAYYLGHTEQFTQLDLDVAIAGVGAYTLATEYWNGAWVAVSGETDGTNDFKNAGTNRISWTLPGDQVARTVTNQPGPTALFYVRFRVTATGFTTDPVGNTVKLDVTLFERWESSATIISTGLSAKATWIPDGIALF
jgi:hypothetical protein